MPGQPQQNLYPIEAFEMFNCMLSEQLQNAEEQYQSLEMALADPYKLDNMTVQRVKNLYESEAELAGNYEQQVEHWKKEPLTIEQQQDIALFAEKISTWELVIEKILAIVPDLQETTIESLLAKDDMEVGLEALARLLDEESVMKEEVYDWEDGCPMLLEINQRYFVREFIALEVGMTPEQVVDRLRSHSYGTYDLYRDQFTFVTAFSNEEEKVMSRHPDLVPLPEELMKDILLQPVYKQIGQTLVPIETEENTLLIVELSNRLIEVMDNSNS